MFFVTVGVIGVYSYDDDNIFLNNQCLYHRISSTTYLAIIGETENPMGIPAVYL